LRLKRSSIPSVISSGIALLALAGCSVNGGSSGAFDSGESTFTPETIRKFSDHPVYWLGTHFERWNLSRILGPYRAGGTISFIYGDCTPRGGDEPSCSPPIDVQVSPLCRHLAPVAANPIWRRRHIRGAPVGTIDNAPVMFTSTVQVKVYQGVPDSGLSLRALRALRSANLVKPVIDATQLIPPAPVPVLEGTRACS
jgi:hypothetical protein